MFYDVILYSENGAGSHYYYRDFNRAVKVAKKHIIKDIKNRGVDPEDFHFTTLEEYADKAIKNGGMNGVAVIVKREFEDCANGFNLELLPTQELRSLQDKISAEINSRRDAQWKTILEICEQYEQNFGDIVLLKRKNMERKSVK